MKYPLAKILSSTGIAAAARNIFFREGKFVLIFHGIISKRRPELNSLCQSGLTAEELDSILRWIKKRFKFMSFMDFLDSKQAGVLLTFDDGKANNFHNAIPLLERYEAPAVFFVSTQHVIDTKNWLPFTRKCAESQFPDFPSIPEETALDLYDGMKPEEVEKCADHPLISIGSHAVSHKRLTGIDDEDLLKELTESKSRLEGWTKTEVDSFAYPSGGYDGRVIEAVKKAGYKYAFAVKSGKIGEYLYEIPRIDIGFPYPHYLDLKLSGLHRAPVKYNFNVHHQD